MTTDDDRLAELFRAAASDAGAPPAGFGHAEVVSASRRITARRRSALIGGAFAVFAVVGVGVVATLPSEGPTASTAAAPAVADQAEQAERAERAAGAPDVAAAPEAPGAAAVPDAAAVPEGAAGSGGPGADPASPLGAPGVTGPPLGPGTGPCADRQDPRLRAYLEQVLPEVIGAPAAASTDECLPGGQRYVTVEAQDGAARGLLGVSYLPPGTPVEPTPGSVSAPTASGGTVVVYAGPIGGTVPPPFLNRIREVAAFLAPRL